MPLARCCRVASGEATGADDARVLEIALAPSPVAGRKIDERRRALFVGAAEVGQHVDRVSGAQHEPRLDEIVAENVAAKRWSARQVRQSAMISERARADDRVMSPVVSIMPHPGAQARGDDRAGDPGGELLEAREHRVAVHDERQTLNDAGVGVRLHRRRQAHDRLPRHQAIGVKHDHVRVVAAPMADEIGNVARLAAQILPPSPIIEVGLRQPRAHRQKRALFRYPDVGVGGVGDEEEVECIGLPGALDVLEDGLHGAEHARGRLVVDRHHDRCSLT